MIDAPTILLITEPHMRPFAAVKGSPLEGRCHVRQVNRLAGEDEVRFAARVDAVLSAVDGVVCAPWTWSIPRLSQDRWKTAKRLKVIAGAFSHRYNQFLDCGDAARRGLCLIDTSRAMSPSVAEFGLAMMLNLMRDIPAAIDLVRAGGWREGETWDKPGFVSGDLSGKRIGLAGFGAIGRRLAALLQPFACELAAFDPHCADEDMAQLGVTRVGDLVELARCSEVLVVTIPPSPGNDEVVSAAVIDALAAGSALVLLSRMAVVDQHALWRRAEAGEIRAAVDVFAPEPPPSSSSVRNCPSVLATPHIAGAQAHCHRLCFTIACQEALVVLDGGSSAYNVLQAKC